MLPITSTATAHRYGHEVYYKKELLILHWIIDVFLYKQVVDAYIVQFKAYTY